ncbi:MAG: hypothetical protein ACFFCZ_24565 [Promethearchaeota archaeon]
MTSTTSATIFDFSIMRITGVTAVLEVGVFSHAEFMENSVLRIKKSSDETIFLKINLN